MCVCVELGQAVMIGYYLNGVAMDALSILYKAGVMMIEYNKSTT